jgi:hypothetical protein
MTKSIASNRRLPLIAHGETNPGLRRKACFRGKCGWNHQAGKQYRESEPEPAMSTVENQDHETSGGLGGEAAKAIYRGKPGSVNREKNRDVAS